ncbi:transcriptional regulator [Prauserella marina]|nr:TetR/AcrR family transcriptional regulator [Prauserella marina]ASR39622.1 transcriptional regulator [Prauserella marina]
MRSVRDLTAQARIRDAALERFGFGGVAATSVRAIAATAGVSPALVLHHFGSKEGLRQACDEHVLAAIRSGPTVDGVIEQGALTEILRTATPVRRYLGRALLEGSEAANVLFAEIVDATQQWLADGEAQGWATPTTDARARAVTYVAWLLAPLLLSEQVSQLLGGDVAEPETSLRGARAGLEMLTGGLFTDDRWLSAFTAIVAKEQAR